MNLSPIKKVVYALGQFGLVLCAFGAGSLFVGFFVDRTFSTEIQFPAFIYQNYLFGIFTVAGLILALNKLIEAVAGLFFGWASDRNPMKRGRRSGFMLIAVFPVSVFSVLLFFPPFAHALVANSIFVLVCTVLFYFSLSLYASPYLALLSEFGKTSRDRLVLSTLLACATALASLLGNRIFYFMENLQAVTGLTALSAFRVILAGYAIVAGICMLLPVLLIDEKKMCSAAPVPDTFSASLNTVWQDLYFRTYVFSDILYRIASAFIQLGFVYYIIVLLGLSRKTALFFQLLVFFANLVLFFPVSLLTRRKGKRKTLFFAFILLMFVIGVSAFAGSYPVDPYIQGIILSLLLAVPFSVFTVVPNALVSDLVYVSERKTGIQRGGMYFGVYSLATKAGVMFSSLIIPLITAIGAEPGHAVGRSGLRFVLLAAGLFTIAGFLFLFAYHEKEITVVLDRD